MMYTKTYNEFYAVFEKLKPIYIHKFYILYLLIYL
jgi:hypothetical protein